MHTAIFKLTSGEEIIGRYEGVGTSASDSGIVHKMTKVRTLLIRNASDGNIRVEFVPWVIGCPDEEIQLNHHAIASGPVSPIPDLEKAYMNQTSDILL